MPGTLKLPWRLRRRAGQVVAQLVARDVALRIDHHDHVEVEVVGQVLVLRRIDGAHPRVDAELLQHCT